MVKTKCTPNAMARLSFYSLKLALLLLLALAVSTATAFQAEKHRRRHTRSRRNSCWSRSEQHVSHGWRESSLAHAVRQQAALQRTCASPGRSWTAEEEAGGEGEGDMEACRYVMPVCEQGLGNRLLTLVSAFLYAMLTGRTLVIGDVNLHDLLCEPFSGSSWLLPDNIALSIKEESTHAPRAWELVQQESKGLRKKPVNVDLLKNGSKLRMTTAYLRWDAEVADHNFFCELEQIAISNAKWLVIESDQYFLPGLFLIPSFQQRLEELFPNRDPFSQLSSVLLHPSNVVWERVTRLENTYFRNAARRVGIQVRTFADSSVDGTANPRILECVVNVSKVLPQPLPSAALEKLLHSAKASNEWPNESKEAIVDMELREMEDESISNITKSELKALHTVLENDVATAPVTAVLVTSLHSGHWEYLREKYVDGLSQDGTLVELVSLSHSQEEVHQLVQDRQAFTEMWLLSRSDELITSDFSTFGYISAGLGRLRPWLLNNRMGGVMLDNYTDNGRAVCYRALSFEPCFHFFPQKNVCSSGNRSEPFGKSLTYLNPCRDFPQGVRLVSEQT